MRDRTTGKPRGFGFITFTDVESVQKVRKEDLELNGRKMDVKLAVPEGNNRDRGGDGPSRDLSTKKIFVGGLDPRLPRFCLLSHAFPVPGLRFLFKRLPDTKVCQTGRFVSKLKVLFATFSLKLSLVLCLFGTISRPTLADMAPLRMLLSWSTANLVALDFSDC